MPIRVRLVGFFTLAAALAFALGGWFFVAQLREGLVRSLDANIAAQWSVAAQGAQGPQGQQNFQDGGGGAIGASTSNFAAATSAGTEYLVQVLSRSGRVVESNHAAGTAPLVGAAQLRRAGRGALVASAVGPEGDEVRLLAAPAAGHSRYLVVVGASLDTVDATVATVRRDLLATGFVVVLASGLGAWLLATAALSPVEHLRRQVDELSEADEDVSVEVPKTRDEIAALARTMNALLARLHQALVRQRSFVADAGHELRTPFAILQAELELAGRTGRTRAELQAAVANAAEETGRLSRLAEHLLFLARSDQGAPLLEIGTVRVRPVLERSAEFARTRAGSAGVELVVEGPEDLEADLDPLRVRQAVDNLVDNALRFAPKGTEIALVAEVTDHRLHIAVTDDGPGFPSDFLPHAFERFRRPDAGRARSEGGAGLGLAIVAAIAQAHHGRAFARNRRDGGAEVGVELPRRAEDSSATRQALDAGERAHD